MVDQTTLAAYDTHAATFATEWEDDQDAPDDLYELLDRFFIPGSVFEIGCGSGRDAAWLASRGYVVTGYDASEGLLAEARERHPGVRFELADLPSLAELGPSRATNVLCETVLMHLPSSEIAHAVRALYSHVEAGGVLYLSWRVTPDEDLRDSAGRLYSAFDSSLVLGALDAAVVLHEAERRSISSGRAVHRLIVRRPA